MSGRHAGAAHRERWRVVLGVAGEVLITAGVVIALFVAWQLWFTGFYAQNQQQALLNQVQQDWGRRPVSASSTPSADPSSSASASPSGSASPAASPEPGGEVVAVLRIPRLGSGWVKAVVPGVGVGDLRRGPGHYPGTAMPGQIGNFAVAGHRTSYGQPFYHLDALRPGDVIGVETPTTWYLYTVTGSQVVAPDDASVILPVPGHPGEAPTQAQLTLTTCTPLFTTAQRLVVHAQLTGQQPRSAGTPSGLA